MLANSSTKFLKKGSVTQLWNKLGSLNKASYSKWNYSDTCCISKYKVCDSMHPWSRWKLDILQFLQKN